MITSCNIRDALIGTHAGFTFTAMPINDKYAQLTYKGNGVFKSESISTMQGDLSAHGSTVHLLGLIKPILEAAEAAHIELQRKQRRMEAIKAEINKLQAEYTTLSIEVKTTK